MSKNALPVTVMIRGSAILNFLPDLARKGNFACVQLKTILRSSHHFLCGSQPLIPTGERSELLTHTAAMESVSLCTRMKS
ncbi:MAG: hypothetical protein DME88_04990 [Verrucomicrobia bacterium]|nr:MAG: hypothetical protein DME88_04990 [Verrucomicrobiota bacterium]